VKQAPFYDSLDKIPLSLERNTKIELASKKMKRLF
jgi:hypothetical protein